MQWHFFILFRDLQTETYGHWTISSDYILTAIDFRRIWHLGALGGCNILPRGVGTFSPLTDTFLKHVFCCETCSANMLYVVWKRVFLTQSYVYMYGPKCHYQTDRMDRGSILRLRETNSGPWKHVSNKIPEVDFQLFKLPCNWFVSLWMMNNYNFFLFVHCFRFFLFRDISPTHRILP